jgi:tetratricopeptide (TPR) repeat protein
MDGSQWKSAGVVGLLGTLVLAGGTPAAEPTSGEPGASRPPWQRLLQGADARKAADLQGRIDQLQQAGKWEEALPAAKELLELRQKVQGKDHWEAVEAHWMVQALRAAQRQTGEVQKEYTTLPALDHEAQALEARGRYREAQPVRQKALDIRRKVLGEQHPHTAFSYNSVAATLAAQGLYREADEGYRKALDIYRTVLGEEHPDTATGYNNVAGNLDKQGHHRAAEEGFKKALAIYRKVVGEEDPTTAAACNNVAMNLNAQGRYREAEEGLRKALAICRKVLGEKHAATATCCNNVAINLDAQGRFREAEELYKEAVVIYRKVLGEEHPNTAQGYNNLAGNLDDQGRYSEAEEGYKKALDLKRKVLGEDHPSTAESYNNLALNLHRQARYREAEEGFRKALAICRKVLGEEHPLTAQGYNNVAFNLEGQGRHKEAEEGYRTALETRRKVLGEDHPETARSYNNVAFNLGAQGRNREAEEVFRKALSICRKALGEEHPDTARSYGNLALSLSVQGRYREAEELHRKALVIDRKVLGEEHPATVSGWNNLALNLHAQGRYEEAEQLYGRGADAFLATRLRVATSGLGRASKTSERSPLLHFAAVLARNGKPAAAWQRLEQSLGRGTWDDLSARLRRPARDTARQGELTNQLQRLDQLLSQHQAIREPTPAQQKERDDLLQRRLNVREELARFTRYLEETYGPGAGKVFDRAEIQAILADDTALVAWIDIPAAVKAADPDGEHWAFLLRRKGDPVCVRLKGSGDADAWTAEDANLATDLLTALRERRGGWQRLARRLHRQRLTPLEKHLGARDGLPAVRRLLVLPSSGLAGVPVELFAEGSTVSYALSGTLHAHLHGQKRPTSQGLLALADPAFDLPARSDEPTPPLPERGVLLTAVLPGSNAARARLRPGDVLLRYRDTDLNGPDDFKPQTDGDTDIAVTVWREGKTFETRLQPGKLGVVLAKAPAPKALAEQRDQDHRLAALREEKWTRLPGTRIEVEALQRLFGEDPRPELLLGSQASEQRLDEMARNGALAKYRYVHLATHGEVDDSFPLRSAVLLARDKLPDAAKQLEAGLPVYDAHLTAQEVLQKWNLQSELVTLSACQSALGRYEHGEGFVGFAQAFLLCGSRSVCLSLWPVDDAATALLMQRFYANLLRKREGLKAPLGKAAALAEAKTWLRNLSAEEALALSASLRQGVVRAKRPATPREPATEEKPKFAKGTKPYAHPYYWAAFVLIGDPE